MLLGFLVASVSLFGLAWYMARPTERERVERQRFARVIRGSVRTPGDWKRMRVL